MKFLPSQLLYFFQNRTTRRNLVLLSKFFALLVVIITIYSVLFHVIMVTEGKNFSWITGFYWTLTVMSTLGFGDITFKSDIGLFFTLLVLLSGVILLLIMLPFTFIQFFYAPWLDAQEKSRTPRQLPEGTSGHIILTGFDPISERLVEKFKAFGYEYVFLEADHKQALELHDAGYNVVMGDPDDPETYNRIRIQNAALVIASHSDQINTLIAFTIREVTESIPIIVTAENEHSVDILKFPGNIHVFQFMKILGEALATATLGCKGGTKIIANFDYFIVAEFLAFGSSLAGQTLSEARIREYTGMSVVGLWEKGKLVAPLGQTIISKSTVLVLAGTEGQLKKFDDTFASSCVLVDPDLPVLILGGGRVGQAAAQTLASHNIKYTVMDKNQGVVKRNAGFIQGDAADLKALDQAGIANCRSVLITTHDDAMNIYLTFYCRQLRPDVQIVSRTTLSRNIAKLHSAGAGLVMSYASMGSRRIMNILRPDDKSMFTDGVNVFTSEARLPLHGLQIIDSRIREKTGCSIVAITSGNRMISTPGPDTMLQNGDELVLVGTNESIDRYKALYE